MTSGLFNMLQYYTDKNINKIDDIEFNAKNTETENKILNTDGLVTKVMFNTKVEQVEDKIIYTGSGLVTKANFSKNLRKTENKIAYTSILVA